MVKHIGLVLLALFTSFSACASDEEKIELAAGEVRQINTTQAHLRAMNPVDDTPRKANAPLVARLVGKMLSAQVKGLNIELSNEPEPASQTALQNQPEAWRLNRRAEICYENYRLGFKRGGMALRYEVAF